MSENTRDLKFKLFYVLKISQSEDIFLYHEVEEYAYMKPLKVYGLDHPELKRKTDWLHLYEENQIHYWLPLEVVKQPYPIIGQPLWVNKEINIDNNTQYGLDLRGIILKFFTQKSLSEVLDTFDNSIFSQLK